MTDETIRIAIGTERKQWVACEVLKHSILRRTSRPVEFVESWTPNGDWSDKGGNWFPGLMEARKSIKGGTAFSLFRWFLAGIYREGKALYLDADQIVLTDIGELWDLLTVPGPHAIACVCNADGFFGPDRVPEKDAPQTSVMLADVKQLETLMWQSNIVNRVKEQKESRKHLMQAAWIPRQRILELPPEWNHFGILRPNTKLIHFSHVDSQPYRNPDHENSELFCRELRDAVEHGVFSTVDLGREVERGYLHGVYLKRLRRDAA